MRVAAVSPQPYRGPDVRGFFEWFSIVEAASSAAEASPGHRVVLGRGIATTSNCCNTLYTELSTDYRYC